MLFVFLKSLVAVGCWKFFINRFSLCVGQNENDKINRILFVARFRRPTLQCNKFASVYFCPCWIAYRLLPHSILILLL